MGLLPWFATTTSHVTSRTLPVPSTPRAVQAMCCPTPPVFLMLMVGPSSVTLQDRVVSTSTPDPLNLKHSKSISSGTMTPSVQRSVAVAVNVAGLCGGTIGAALQKTSGGVVSTTDTSVVSSSVCAKAVDHTQHVALGFPEAEGDLRVEAVHDQRARTRLPWRQLASARFWSGSLLARPSSANDAPSAEVHSTF